MYLHTLLYISVAKYILINQRHNDYGKFIHTPVRTCCIAGKFGGKNVWRIYSFQAFGKKSLANE